MSIGKHITAGPDSRLMVSALFAFAYQDSGFESVLNSGNLDASDRIATGSTFAVRALARRNTAAPALAHREGVAA